MEIEEASTSSRPSSSSSLPSLEDCMKLLKGENDSQRLAGLLLVTKFCDKDNQQTVHKVYDAVGPSFLHRLLLTGMGKGDGGGDNANREAYLQLAVTVLAAFARVPEIAASEEMVSKVPLFLEVMSNVSSSPFIDECYEFLFLVSSAHEEGVVALYESGGMNILASQMPTLPEGSHTMELAMKLIQLMISKLPAEKFYVEHPSELSKMVAAIAKQFAVLHNALKFEALHLLSAILSSNYSGFLNVALQSMAGDDWSTNMRIGIVAVLQNRVAPAEKLQALVLAEHVISIDGEGWLIGPMNLPNVKDSFPADRCILLVLESSRVEIAVLLNELAYLKYEASKNSSSDAETFVAKQRNLGVAFSLVEKIIKLISKLGDSEELNSNSIISETTFMKIISGLNETVGVVLDYLQDAKEHRQKKGDDLLASVRIVGNYLAEAPHACNEKVKELLSYMLSVEGEDEHRPFHSICFLLPMLCQMTMRTEECKDIASSGALRAVAGCLICLIESNSNGDEDGGTVFLACDTILNFLLKREQICFPLDDPSFIKLLQALSHLTEKKNDPSSIMMASSICALILGSTSEEALLCHPDFDIDSLISLSQLVKKSLAICSQGVMSDDASTEADLCEIVTSVNLNAEYSSWADRFPRMKEVIER
ncbi:neurochondrin isoform X1 [Olea europaea subsp. europaea]|uniref:Neurochondrin isoform X1 n=1 Tax=Olea europaea subsp. europaea TaxID=158383 RepID=A0A8S0PM88_OLEEU|nr:neurochondrin isoform X1 [Olea europaea subsp. europaea]